MARVTREVPQASVQEVEVFDLALTQEEKSAFRADPEKFARTLLEAEGHTVNRIVIDSSLRRTDEDDPGDDDFPCPGPLKLVHATVGHLRSTWVWICPNPI
ncbi:hypothetical protein [Kitasatospora sp. NPDC097643]|uniref:hypothetical protein n=1 Tax=Kitasatospora sp. NPDC097643 TaxID=3157230 RepID=UPI0033341DAB